MPAYATVLAILVGSDSDDAVLNAAGRMVGAGGGLRAMTVRSDPARVLPIVGEAGAAAAAELMTVLEQQAKERAARARSNFSSWRSRAKEVRAEFEELEGHPSETAAAAARNTDLVVVARPRDEAEPLAASLFEACLFGSGRPVLVVPKSTPATFGASIVVLWDGSRTAARALGDALPLLAGARSVLVVTCGRLDEEVPTGEAVAARLNAQGLPAKARSLEPGDGEPAALAAAASEAGCDLIVMGGYGHSRVREMILGGVTRHMLGSAPVPLLMSH